MRKWRENEEKERDSLSTFPHFLFISSLSIHFLYLNLSLNVKKKAQKIKINMLYEEIILGRIRCEEEERE